MKLFHRVVQFSTLLFFAGVLCARETETINGHEVAARQAILKISAAAPPVGGYVQQLMALGDADDFRPLNSAIGIYLIHSRTKNVTALISVLKSHPAVAFVEPDYIVKTVTTPNDPDFPQQWDMYNSAFPGADIGASSAWTISTGSSNNVIGVVDTGIDYTHQDLAGNVWSAPAAFSVSLSWGQLTCPAGSHGYNAVARSCNPADDNQHGTHVSGTIGAIGNNALGVTGVNWTASIMALKFLDSTGSGSVSDAIDAIEFGLQAKAAFGARANLRVLSNSWGGSGFSQALLDEINKANTSDVLFVVAAGNNGSNDDVAATYPASYTAPNILTVAATTNTDGLASFSNYGPTTVHLGAPGVNILSTVPNNSYAYLSGTSMATPHVSGAAMLVLSRCGLNTAGVKNAILANVDHIAALQGMTVTGGRLNVNNALRSCATAPVTGSAAFVKTDTATSGSWKSVYGADGYDVIGDTARLPSYVAANPSGNASYTWISSTSDPRALQKGSSSDRIAACWYSGSSFTINLNFNDANAHQIALYVLDWDGYNGGRSERVDVLDGNGTLLDTRSISSFGNGVYLVWNLSGQIVVRVTNSNPASNAVIGGLFFGGAGSVSGSPASASFLKTDNTTSGSWKGVYGSEGYDVIGDSASIPSYVAQGTAGNASYTWTSSTTDPRALQKASSSDRIASCWYSSGSFTIDLAFNDSNAHQVALYLLDWDNYGGGRSERVDVLDGNGNVLDTHSISNFGAGLYLVWNLSGHVIVRITSTNPSSNGLVTGLFFGGASSSATASFLKSDSTTSGTWKGVYGADGYDVIGDSASIPSYVAVSAAGNGAYTWASSTSDPRALQDASSSARIASCWYSSNPFTINLPFSDGATHQVALYFLDWDGYGGGRSERIDILDGNGNTLDTRSISNFGNGVYLVWNLSGRIAVRITNTQPSSNGVVSGLFFR